MFMCICAQVDEKTVEDLIKDGKTVEEIQYATGLGSGCGTCLSNMYYTYNNRGDKNEHEETDKR